MPSTRNFTRQVEETLHEQVEGTLHEKTPRRDVCKYIVADEMLRQKHPNPHPNKKIHLDEMPVECSSWPLQQG